jgi:hypothetical protein
LFQVNNEAFGEINTPDALFLYGMFQGLGDIVAEHPEHHAGPPGKLHLDMAVIFFPGTRIMSATMVFRWDCPLVEGKWYSVLARAMRASGGKDAPRLALRNAMMARSERLKIFKKGGVKIRNYSRSNADIILRRAR